MLDDIIISAGVGITAALVGVAMGGWFGRLKRGRERQREEGAAHIAKIADQRLKRIIELEKSCAAYKANNTRMKQRIAELVKLLPIEQLGQLELNAPAPGPEVSAQ